MIKEKIKKIYQRSVLYKTIDSLVSYYFKRRLHNENFTILCSNCLAGCIYHRLDLKFLSPTINILFTQPDFVEFCVHLDEYEKAQLHFIKTERSYPVATLGDGKDIPQITIEFVHYLSEKDAADKWYERFKRVNRKNLYIILYNYELTSEHIKALKKIEAKNIIIINGGLKDDIISSHIIKPTRSHGYNFLFKDFFGLRYYEKQWDFVSFLNKGS